MDDAEIHSAFIYAFPIYEMAKLRRKALFDRTNAAHTGLNRFWHQERLSTHADRWVTTPNVDTLYSVAWLALDQGPVKLDLPPTGGRYLSVAMLDMFTDNFDVIGPRNCSSAGATLFLAGPDCAVEVPDNARVIHAPSNDIMLLARVVAAPGDDEKVANTLQEQLVLTPLGLVRDLPQVANKNSDAEDCVALLRDAFARNPPRTHEKAMRDRLIALGLMVDPASGAYASAEQFADRFASYVAALPEANRIGRPPVGGWTYTHPSLGNFGTFYRLRSQVALGGLLALPQTEAIYISSDTDAENALLDGSNQYVLRVPPGGIPADSFWSITMYEVEPNGARFLVDNPIRRYCLNDRSPGLDIRPDGSIDVFLQRAEPAVAKVPNWLPTPAGPFRVVVRAYLPRASLIDGRFRMPPIEKAS